ncbi:MAG: tetratricopeptide repeat protein [Myxococcota bacterium]
MPVREESSSKGVGPVWVLLGILVLGAPMAVGSVHPPAVAACALLSGVTLMLHSRARRRQGRRIAPGLIPLALAVGALWSLLQALPLPMFLLRLLSPHAAELHDVMSPDGTAAWGALSGAPLQTLMAASALWTLACTTTVTLDLARQEQHRRFLLALPAVTGLMVLGVAALAIGMDWSGPWGLYNIPSITLLRSTFINTNHAAAALSLGAFGCFGLALGAGSRSQTWAWSASALACVVGVVLCGSNGAVVAMGLGVALTSFLIWRAVWRMRRHSKAEGPPRGSRTLAVLALVAIGPLMLLVLEGPDLLGLQAQAQRAAELKLHGFREAASGIPQYFLTGLGRGAFTEVFARHRTTFNGYTLTSPENVLLLLPLEWGVPFAALYLAAWWAQLWAWFRRQRSVGSAAAWGGLLAIGAHNLFDFNLEILGVALPFCALLGAAREEPQELKVAMTREERHRRARRGQQLTLLGGAALAVLSPLPALYATRHGMQPSRQAIQALPVAERLEPLRAHLSRHPSDYLAALMMARAFNAQQPPQTDQALRWINRALFLNPMMPDSHADAGRLLWEMGFRDQATLEFAQARRFPIPNWEPVTFRELAGRGLDADQMWTVFPDQPPRWVCDAFQAHAMAGPAERCWQRLAVLRPDDPDVLAGLAVRALGRGEVEEAVQRASHALEVSPGHVEATLALSRALRAAGRVGDSEAALAEAVRANPGAVEVERERFQRALAEGRLEDARRVLKTYTQALTRRGLNLAEGMMAEAQLEERAGNPQEAIRHYRNAVDANPDDPRGALNASRVAQQAGHPDDALTILREALIDHPHPAYMEQIRRLEGEARNRMARARARLPEAAPPTPPEPQTAEGVWQLQ